MKQVLLRCFLWLFRGVCYRLTVRDVANLPAAGGALLVSNHVSFVDMLLIIAGTPRPVRFVLPSTVYALRWLRPFLRWLGTIQLPGKDEPREMIRALRQARERIQAGELVCIFGERSVSRIGVLLPFGQELERIMEGVGAPIIPVCLDGVWGSIFSYQKGRFFWKLPKQLRYPVSLSFGRALPPTARAFEVRTAIQELATEAWPLRRATMKPLHRAFVQCARRCPTRFAMADGKVPRLSFAGALLKTIFLARRLRATWSGQEHVGILLPPSVPAALVNHAALLMGKVPVNLNYTLSEEALASCAEQCGLKSILTSQMVLEKIKVKLPLPAVLLEQVAKGPRLAEKLMAVALTWLAPIGLLERSVGRTQPGSIDDLATLIFSSGSTGQPKGVMLTHYNIASNVEQFAQTFDFAPGDRFMGALPFFHSFGFMATLASPALAGLGVVYHPNPLDAKAIGELVKRYQITCLMATPTFLQLYLRTCEPGDFGSLKIAMVAAEKLPDWLATAFEQKFGLRPLEGYGCTECAPGVTVNTRDFRAAGFRQEGSRRGSIGRPLPGVSVRVVDPETREPLTVGQAGLLLVRGPNVMRGYLGMPEKTAEVLQDGWYVTGDIAALDEEGFVHITDRLSRFSKIGGEMVPHIKIEEKLHEAAKLKEISFAVTGVPDPAKGERLVVLHTLAESSVPEVLRNLQQFGLPNLWVPRANQFCRVEGLPLLASGKMDLRRIKETALAFAAAQSEEGARREHVKA